MDGSLGVLLAERDRSAVRQRVLQRVRDGIGDHGGGLRAPGSVEERDPGTEGGDVGADARDVVGGGRSGSGRHGRLGHTVSSSGPTTSRTRRWNDSSGYSHFGLSTPVS